MGRRRSESSHDRVLESQSSPTHPDGCPESRQGRPTRAYTAPRRPQESPRTPQDGLVAGRI
eukprot:7796513-Pyramimonas_sp.AAC.1